MVRPTSGAWSGTELVLRRYTKPELVAKHPDLAAREAEVLRRLEGSGLSVPRLVAVDPEGDVAILEVDTQDATPVEWANGSADLTIGAPVFA